MSVKSSLKKVIPTKLTAKALPAYHLLEAVLANIRYGFAARGLYVVGITGTNGKTTTANIIGTILKENNFKVGVMSTALIWTTDWVEDNSAKLTTDNPFVLQRNIRRMRKSGVTHLILEVSSHAIDQHRIWGIPFRGAVFTNLSQDHLDYHKTMENYANTKKKLLLRAKEFTVVNKDDERYCDFNVRPSNMALTYGQGEDVDLRITKPKITTAGSSAVLVTKKDKINVKVRLTGMFNLYNVAAASGIALKMKLAPKAIEKGLEAVKSVPGRMEIIDVGQEFSVIVDFAHSEDSLKNTLGSLRENTKGKLMLLLGADGERDEEKRGQMAGVAAELCDYVIVCDQEPYGDPPEPIRQDLINGLKKAGYDKYEEVIDRTEAIAKLFSLAEKGDTVVLAGMGDKKTRGLNTGKIPWDEREVAREQLRKLLK